MRGDRPTPLNPQVLLRKFTPHAGIDPMYHIGCDDYICLPRMRGDRPYTHPLEYFKMEFTPHARGSTF